MPRPLLACLAVLALVLGGALASRWAGVRPEPVRVFLREDPPRSPSRGADARAPGDFLGVLIPSASVEIASRTEGRVEHIEVQVGAHVQAGAPLVRMDPQPLRQELAIARAAHQSAQAQEQLAQVALAEANARTQRYAHPGLRQLQALPEEELAAAAFQEKSAAARLQSAQAQVREQLARVEQLQQRLEEGVLK
ncbi:MAG: biotin/lipoyl-binding protein, partial [Cystobacter sp.]